jgi:5-carboxymethyl-2-hydroxymuconate isomerase
MPHLRLEVPEEWLRDDFKQSTGFDAKKLLDTLVDALVAMQMDSDAGRVPLINKSNLKHAIVPLYYAHTAGDPAKRFLHATLAAGNDVPGRTPEVRSRAAAALGEVIDEFVIDVPGIASVTVWMQDIDRSRGYSTTAERKKRG